VLIANLESDDPELFKLAAEVKLQRRLRNLQRIDDTRDIDVTFISCAEYQLFLDEMREKKEFYQPEHWTEFRFPKGSALQPIIGVRPEATEKFCEWLSKKENKKYRHPTLAEAQEFFAAENQEIATWCNGNSSQWNSPRTKQQIESKVEKLLKGSEAVKYFRRDKFALTLSNNLTLAGALSYIHAYIMSPLNNNFNFITFTGSYNTSDTYVLLIHALTYDFVTHDYNSSAVETLKNIFHGYYLRRDSPLVGSRLAHALVFIFNSNSENNVFQNFLGSGDLSAAQHQLQQFHPPNTAAQRKKNLLGELLNILTTENLIEQQQAWFRYLGYLAEYAVIGYEMLEKKYSWWQKLFRLRSYTDEKEAMAAVYAWTKILEARLKGELPAWEGIRIVRERDV